MHIPTAIKLHKASKTLELRYGEQRYLLSAEFLRVHSPSAEVQGHGNPVLQYGKQQVALTGLEPAGNYASSWCSTTAMTAACTAGTTCTSWPPIRTNSGRTTCSD